MELKKELLRKCKDLGIPLVGMAPVKLWRSPPDDLPNKLFPWIPEKFWPQSIYPEARTVIVIGLPVPLPIVETAPSIYYHELYKTVNSMLDQRAYEIANFLTEKDHPSIYLPRDGYGDVKILIEKPFAFFSHKHAAYLAGMGSFGQNNVLLTPEYGPRVRFTSIFTEAEIKPDMKKCKDLCIRCLLCVKNCPVNAIPEKGDFPPPVDKRLCAERSTKLRDEYRSPCGICIKVCPVGKDRELFGRKNMSIYKDNKRFEKYHRAWEHVRRYGSYGNNY
ncbi:MAG: epoxyqueuosine reductase [Candidatus Methanoperedens sp.]|nr:epoxyqueuosine reductase [Candidatus Methanoperedens sp.]MCE8425468.1 epoxyqueuosine reductase [Candidatus Methanoperedens sp.]MCE8427929.1 epoxyqueuosine reductase [Candidatus Methanoperedens sp.]